MEKNYDLLELELWHTRYQLAKANIALAQAAMQDLEPRILARQAELAEKEKSDG